MCVSFSRSNDFYVWQVIPTNPYLTARMLKRRLLTEPELLAEMPWLTKRLLREMRFQKRIPFFALSYRIRLYDPEAILAALERCEIKAK